MSAEPTIAGDFRLFAEKGVLYHGVSLQWAQLKYRERNLLVAFMSRPDEALSFPEIAAVLWPSFPPHSAASSIKVAIHRLRTRMRVAGMPNAIKTMPAGTGYAFVTRELDA